MAFGDHPVFFWLEYAISVVFSVENGHAYVGFIFQDQRNGVFFPRHTSFEQTCPVQLYSNFPRTRAFQITTEYLPHDCGLGFVNIQAFSLAFWHCDIAIWHATTIEKAISCIFHHRAACIFTDYATVMLINNFKNGLREPSFIRFTVDIVAGIYHFSAMPLQFKLIGSCIQFVTCKARCAPNYEIGNFMQCTEGNGLLECWTFGSAPRYPLICENL
nr:hypothetical protein [Methylobacillus caricis]